MDGYKKGKNVALKFLLFKIQQQKSIKEQQLKDVRGSLVIYRVFRKKILCNMQTFLFVFDLY